MRHGQPAGNWTGSESLDLAGAAAMLHCSEKTALRLIRSGELRAVEMDGQYLLLHCDVMAFLRARIEHQTAQRAVRTPRKETKMRWTDLEPVNKPRR